MMTIGWDIGGAHLKAAAALEGTIVATFHIAMPLWLGLDRLEDALAQVLRQLPKPRRHAVTMTGELCDLFPSRREGVRQILACLRTKTWPDPIVVFQRPGKLIPLEAIDPGRDWPEIASANWLAAAHFLARHVQEALLVDLGSTTTDLLPIRDHRAAFRGRDDFERLASGELLYLGVGRTPLAVLADQVPFRGERVSVMNEGFATAADIFRLTGELAPHVDQYPTADGGPKDRVGSARRLARMIGLDLEAASMETWEEVARFWREKLLQKLHEACSSLLIGNFPKGAPLVGAGTGRFLLPELARRLNRPYREANEWFSWTGEGDFTPADLLPASALALLAERDGER